MQCFLLLLMIIRAVDMQLAADIFSCSDETKSAALHFAEYSPVQICCQLMSPKWCNDTTSKYPLTLLPESETECNGSCSVQMYRVDSCLVKFEISSASSIDQQKYSCKLNGQKLIDQEIYIIKKPPAPVITSFSCSIENVRTVTFDRGPPDTDYIDIYNVTMIENGIAYDMCNTTQEVCQSSEHICGCKFTLAERINPSSCVTIIISVVRSIQTSETRGIFTIAAHIIPGPVQHLKVSHVGPHDASFKFCMDANTTNFCGFMAKNKAPLYLNVWAYRGQGIPEILKMTIPTALDGFPFCVNKCCQVDLPNLSAFTNYTVIVSGSGGGGEGQRIRIEFTTSETEPVYPPVAEDFSFRRLESDNVSDNISPGLTLFWKPLPHEARGAREFSYYIEIISENGYQTSKTTTTEYAVILDKHLPPDPIIVKLWSQNLLGRSQNYTRLVIPRKLPETALPYMIVDLKGDMAFVLVNLTVHTELTLLVHWCNSSVDQVESGFKICQDYPSTTAFTLKAATKKTYQTLVVNIRDSVELKVIEDYRLINYYNIERPNSPPGMAKTCNATVIMHDHNAIQEMESRRRRDVHSQEKIMFFISLKMGESMSSTGMIPANCYFDSTKDKVSLIVSDFADGSSDSVMLRWSQECNTDIPLQFLAEYFLVFSSTDEHCNEDKKYLGRVNNTLFQPNLLKLPPGTRFTCIQTFRQDGLSAPELTLSSVGVYNKVMTPTTPGQVLVYVLVPVAAVILIVIIIFTIRGILKRKKYIGKMQREIINFPHEDPLSAVPPPMKSNNDSDVAQLTSSNDQISFISSNDSGRFTDTDSKHVPDDALSCADSSRSSSGDTVTGSGSEKSSLRTSDLPGSSSNITQDIDNGCGSNSEKENGCSSDNIKENTCSFHEENETTDADDKEGHGSGRGQESNSDCDQQVAALQRKGWSFNFNNQSSSSSSSATTSGDTTSGETTSGEPHGGETTIGEPHSGETTSHEPHSGETTSGETTSGETHSGHFSSEWRVINSGRKVKGNNSTGISIPEDNSNSDTDGEKSHEFDKECQQCRTSLCSSRRSFSGSQCAGNCTDDLVNPSGVECKPLATVTFNRGVSSESESEGDDLRVCSGAPLLGKRK